MIMEFSSGVKVMTNVLSLKHQFFFKDLMLTWHPWSLYIYI